MEILNLSSSDILFVAQIVSVDISNFKILLSGLVEV